MGLGEVRKSLAVRKEEGGEMDWTEATYHIVRHRLLAGTWLKLVDVLMGLGEIRRNAGTWVIS